MNVSKKIKNSMGDRLGQLRTDKGLSQNQVAEILGMMRVNYTSIENGSEERHLKDSQIIDLANLYNVSSDYILGLTNEKSKDVDIQKIYNEYKLKEEILNKIKLLNSNTIISFNNFITGDHIMPYLFDEMYCYEANKNISKNIILFSKLFNYGELIDKYYKEKNYKELQNIFDYFDKFLIEANKYSSRYLKDEYELLKTYLLTEDFKTLYFQKFEEMTDIFLKTKNFSINIDFNGMDFEIVKYQLQNFQSSNYGNERSGGKLTEINIENYLLYMRSITNKILKDLHKEVAYNKYTISSIFDEYLNRIEGFQYSEDVEKILSEDSFIKVLNKEQNKLKKEGEKDEYKRKSKK